MSRYKQPIIKSSEQKQYPYLGTVVSLIETFFRSKHSTTTKQVFDIIRQYSFNYYKKSLLFSKILNKLTIKKQQANKKHIFGILYQIKISQILLKRQKVVLLKEKCKNQSSVIFAEIIAKNMKLKLYQTFHQLKYKSSLIKQRTIFKIFKIINSVKNQQIKLTRNAFKLIKIQSFDLLAKYKRCFTIERLYVKKRCQNLSFTLNQLRKKPTVTAVQKSGNITSKSNSIQIQQSQQAQTIKQLQEQKKSLQAQLNQIKSSNRTNLKTKQSQLQKMQSQLESVRFSFDLMGQDNIDISQTMKQRQRLTIQSQNQKKQQLSPKRLPSTLCQFNQNDLWKSIFDNMMDYLYKIKSGNSNQIFSQQILIQKMTQPLINLSVYAQRSELQEQNEVLRDLLNSYKQAFNKDLGDNKQNKVIYPLQILNKQRKYLYLALQCLSRWGTTQYQGLEEMKSVLEKLRDKQQNQISVFTH